MRPEERCLVVVLAVVMVTCTHDRTAQREATLPSGADDQPEGELSRPDGELVSSVPISARAPRATPPGPAPAAAMAAPASAADPTIVTEDALSGPVRARDLAAESESRAAAPATPAKIAATTMRRARGARPAASPHSSYASGRVGAVKEGSEVDEVLRRAGGAGKRSAAAAPALKAGRHDDNKEYNRFLAFLDQYAHLVVHATDVRERLLVRALDREGRSLPNCPVVFQTGTGKELAKTTTYADGSTQFFPAADSEPDEHDYVVEIRCAGVTRKGQLARAGARSTEVRFNLARKVPTPMPVDVAIVLDTTGSMQGQIDRLKQTLKAIHYQLTVLGTRPDIRFAMVAYRDKGDEYVTRVTPFTGNIDAYQHMLEQLVADGGGDQPEDLQTALDVAMHQLKWRSDALRIGFVITDAPPHTNYGQAYNYLEAMKEALRRGIKWVTVGAGGLGIDGEVIYRQIAQYTMGEYVFVTQGGGDDSEGSAGEASHHVGANYRTENLDQAIVRIVRRELSYLTDAPKDFDTTILAIGGGAATREQVLAPAVAEALRQLADYSALKLDKKTLVAVAPVSFADKKHKALAEYLTDQLILSASRNDSFKVVERDLAALTQEMKLQLSNLFDETKTVPIGKLVGAELLIVGKLVVKDGDAELFAKLIRVASGEVLSVANVRVTGGAGL